MPDFVFKANTTFLEEKYVTWSEVGLDSPDLSIPPAGLWTWGTNYQGRLGSGTSGAASSRSSPVQVGSLTNWKSVSVSSGHTLAVKTDGTLWAWGTGTNGILGLGNTYHRSSPVQVGGLTTWRKVSTGGQGSSFAISTDGTLWSWGYNNVGSLGFGDQVNRSSPTQLSTSSWDNIATNGRFTLAVKTDGTLWSCGDNYYGQLGSGNRSTNFTLTQQGSLTDWKSVSAGGAHSLAVKKDGTLWSWGKNTNGQLGGGSTSSSPVQVGSLTDWSQVSAGHSSSLALKKDGTLWAWGLNGDGQLGLGDTSQRNSPVQVGSQTNWKSIDAALYASFAVKTDGTLWAWGKNNSAYGNLGLNDTTHRSSPTQIGTLTNWKQISSGFNFTAALKLV